MSKKKYPNVGIKEQGVHGVINPRLVLIATIEEKKYEVEILADKKKLKTFEIITLDDNKSIVINANLPKNTRKVKVFLIVDDDRYEICNLSNNRLFRIKHKLEGINKKIITKIKIFFHVLYKGTKFMWREYHFLVPPKMIGKYLKDFKRSMHSGDLRFYDPFNVEEYNKWLKKYQTVTQYSKMKYEPLISILIPVYNIKKEYLSECLDSILNQNYKNFEVCLVDDCSTLEETKKTLEEYKAKDKRIRVKYRKTNGHISNTTNDALKMAKGEFIVLMDDDDLITKDALLENVIALNKDKKIDFIYSDEDKMNKHGQFCDPHFKPDYSPDTLLSLNYFNHLTMIRKSIVEKVGGFEVGLEGAQDHDLYLKVVEQTNNIHHIPKVLYHWRMVEGSTAATISNKSYATDKGKIAIENALKRRKINGHVEKDIPSTYYRVFYDLKKEPLISIIIPTRDYMDITKKCVDSVIEKTTYKNYEIIIANNESKEKETIEFFKEYEKKYKNFKVVDCNIEFNYSKINNLAIKESKGEYIVLLNNDTELLTPEWLTYMVGYASQKHVGCVGAKLLYPEDQTVQHAGVILGLGGIASHASIGEPRDTLGMYGRLRVPYDYAANTAACIMVSRKKFNEVKGLEEDLHVAYNDVDFNLKLLTKGYYNVFLPQVELLHYESKSRGLDTTSEKYKRFLQESKYMLNKWGKLLNNDPFYNKNFTKLMWFKLDK